MATGNEDEEKYSWTIELQERDHLFLDVATGVDCVAPSMDPSSVNAVHHENLKDEDVWSSDDDADTYSVYTQYSSCLEDLQTQDISALNKKSFKQSLKSTKRSTMKCRRRELTWDAMFMELITQNIAFQRRVLQILESYDVSRVNESSKFSIHAAISVINRMVEDGLVTEGNELWLLAMDLFEDHVKREVFISLPNDDGRLAWLLYKQKMSRS